MQFHIDSYTEERLQTWAWWYRMNQDNGLGYPKQSFTARWLEGGGILTQAQGQKPLPTHEAAEEIEALVVEIARSNFKIADVLRCQYLDQHLSSRQKAMKCGLSYSQFRIYVAFGCQWITGRLSAKNVK